MVGVGWARGCGVGWGGPGRGGLGYLGDENTGDALGVVAFWVGRAQERFALALLEDWNVAFHIPTGAVAEDHR